jgi:hypothetical protein
MPRVKIWMNLLGRWLTTVVFIIAVYAIIIGYERYEVISTRQKRQFNALVTGFLIALALITMSHIINIAVGVKWLILSRGFRSQRKVRDQLSPPSFGSLDPSQLTMNIYVSKD